jgi:ABC-2 type transport system ATP-binding protein
MSLIEIREVSKAYGQIRALRGVSIDVERGEIYGLLGQNGAGKTTLIKVLLGITRGWTSAARSATCPRTTASPTTTAATAC